LNKINGIDQIISAAGKIQGVIKGSGIEKVQGISSILTDVANIPGLAKAIPALSNV